MGKLNREGQAHVLSSYEESKITQALEQPYKLIFQIGMFTGERWGAIRQLQVSAIYDERLTPRDYVTFTSAIRKQSAGQKARVRQVYVHPVLRLALLDYNPPKDGYLFPKPNDPTQPLSFQSCDYHLRRVCYELGLSSLGISTHSTRRTFITRLANKGVNLHELKALTGHKSMDSLLRYIESNPDTQKAAIMAL